MKPWQKILLVSLVIIGFIILGALAVKAATQKPVAPPQPQQGGWLANLIGQVLGGSGGSGGGWLSNLLGGGNKCDPNKNCYQKNGTYNLQCCQTADGGWNPSNVNCVNGCDQNKKGYDCDGFPDASNCGFGG